MTLARHVFIAACCFSLSASAARAQAKKDAAEPEKVSYYKDVRPIFQQHCQGCHQPAKAQGDFVMTDFAELFKKSGKDNPGVVKGDPEKSEIFKQITPRDGKPPRMPQQKEPLSDREVKLIKRWIQGGAADD